ncbi:hypothetical protein RQN30_00480 [Arcanobacterium hippocoleae]
MVREGAQVVVGDTNTGAVAYEVLCRKHHMQGMTAISAKADALSQPTLLDHAE